MGTRILNILAPLGAVVAIIGLSVPADAAMRFQAAAQDEQRMLDDIVGAQIDLASGNRMAALNSAADAETVLLNTRQTGDYNDPKSLTAVEQAHADLLARNSQGATTALHVAEGDLTTPHSS